MKLSNTQMTDSVKLQNRTVNGTTKPLSSALANHVFNYPAPSHLTYNWSFGSLVGLFFALQIVTGIFLSMHYTPHVSYAFASVEHIMTDVSGGYLFRYFHANGASMVFILMYLHIARNLYYQPYLTRSILWHTGLVIFLLLTATAFIGYVLPWGQMSFWNFSYAAVFVVAAQNEKTKKMTSVLRGLAVSAFFACSISLLFLAFITHGLYLRFPSGFELHWYLFFIYVIIAWITVLFYLSVWVGSKIPAGNYAHIDNWGHRVLRAFFYMVTLPAVCLATLYVPLVDHGRFNNDICMFGDVCLKITFNQTLAQESAEIVMSSLSEGAGPERLVWIDNKINQLAALLIDNALEPANALVDYMPSELAQNEMRWTDKLSRIFEKMAPSALILGAVLGFEPAWCFLGLRHLIQAIGKIDCEWTPSLLAVFGFGPSAQQIQDQLNSTVFELNLFMLQCYKLAQFVGLV